MRTALALLWLVTLLPHSSDASEVSVESGFLRNTCSCLHEDDYLLGAGARFTQELGRELALKGPGPTDRLGIEIGAYYYRLENFVATGDEYSILAALADLRYSVPLSDLLEPFAEIGVLKNFVVQSKQPVALAKERLSSNYPAVGVGLLCHVTEKLGFRASLGYEFLGVGASYRF